MGGLAITGTPTIKVRVKNDPASHFIRTLRDETFSFMILAQN
jgi:hypothetical protein